MLLDQTEFLYMNPGIVEWGLLTVGAAIFAEIVGSFRPDPVARDWETQFLEHVQSESGYPLPREWITVTERTDEVDAWLRQYC